MFTDSHCHLYKEYYDNIENILSLAKECNVNRFINNGTDLKSNEEVLKLTSDYPNVYGALGIHPENVHTYKMEDIQFIKKHLNDSKIIAIGEIGLDYHYTKMDRDEQIKLFKLQLDIATKYDIPVIIHSRDATLDTLNILKNYHLKGIIHSFSGSLETALEYSKLGYLIGVNGVITFKNAHIKEVIQKLPLTSLVLETDSPYLTPEPYRGTQNNPSHILDIAKYVANLFNISLEELAKITNQNLERIFKF